MPGKDLPSLPDPCRWKAGRSELFGQFFHFHVCLFFLLSPSGGSCTTLAGKVSYPSHSYQVTTEMPARMWFGLCSDWDNLARQAGAQWLFWFSLSFSKKTNVNPPGFGERVLPPSGKVLPCLWALWMASFCLWRSLIASWQSLQLDIRETGAVRTPPSGSVYRMLPSWSQTPTHCYSHFRPLESREQCTLQM